MAVLIQTFNFIRGAGIVIPVNLPGVVGAAGANERLDVAAAHWGAAEVKISLDGAAPSNATNQPVAVSAAAGMYSLTLTETETTCDTINITIIETTAATQSDLAIQGYSQKHWAGGVLSCGLARASTTGDIKLETAISSVTSGAYVGQIVSIVAMSTGSVNPVGQSRIITAYNGGTQVATVAPVWTTAPDNNTCYQITAGAYTMDDIEGTQPSGAVSDNATFRSIFQRLKRRFFNKVTQTSALQTVYKDDSATVLTSGTCSDDTVTETRNKMT